MKVLQKKGLNKIGDVIIPGQEDMPAFSATGCVKEFSRIADFMPESDRKDLLMVLLIMGLLPRFFLRALWWIIEWAPYIPTPVGDLFRMLRIGIKGLVFSLYYGEPPAAIEYHVGLD